MSKSERRIIINKIRRKQERRKNIVISLLTICLVVTLSLTASGFLSNAQSDNTNVEFKYYKSVMVEQGDTLWSIASRHATSSYKSKDEYIEEVMNMNRLTDDRITVGSYLIIPYFSSEFVS